MILHPVSALEQNLRKMVILRETAGRKEGAAAGGDAGIFCSHSWEASPCLEDKNSFKVLLHKTITTRVKKAKLDPWLELETGRLNELVKN